MLFKMRYYKLIISLLIQSIYIRSAYKINASKHVDIGKKCDKKI